MNIKYLYCLFLFFILSLGCVAQDYTVKATSFTRAFQSIKSEGQSINNNSPFSPSTFFDIQIEPTLMVGGVITNNINFSTLMYSTPSKKNASLLMFTTHTAIHKKITNNSLPVDISNIWYKYEDQNSEEIHFIEVENAGIDGEGSFNYQIISNNQMNYVEIHFGKVDCQQSTWQTGGLNGELPTYCFNYSNKEQNKDFVFYFKGTPSSPTIAIDTVYGSYTFKFGSMGLDSPPDSGTVFRVSFEETTSVSEANLRSPNEIDIFPNPSHGLFEVLTEKAYNIEIYDSKGQLIDQTQINANFSKTIDLNGHPNGFYFLRFISEHQNVVTKKIIKY